MENITRSGKIPPIIIKPIHTKPDHELLSHDFLMAVAIAIEELNFSREETTNWLVRTTYSWIYQSILPDEAGRGGVDFVIKNGNGSIIEIYPEIFDDAYGKDGSFCWNSNVKRFAKRRPLRRPKKAKMMLLRLQLWDAAMTIAGRPIVLPTY